MNKLSIAFLVATALVSFACKKKDGGGGSGATMAKMTEFKDRVCACKDKACADAAQADMMKWMQEQTKTGVKDVTGNEEEAKKMAAVSKEMTDCITKLVSAAAPPPPADPAAAPPAGSGDPAAAPPAGGAADPGAAAGGTVPAGSDAPGSNVDKAAQ